MKYFTFFLWILISTFFCKTANGQGIQRQTYKYQAVPQTNNETHSKVSLDKILLPQTSAEWGVNVVGGLTFVTFLLSDQTVRLISWDADKWRSRNGAYLSRYDKVEHFGLAAIGHGVLIGLDRANLVHSTPFRRIKLSLLAITWWEIKDSVVPWERYGSFGGEGFSTKDWLASTAAVGCTEVLNLILGKALASK